MRLNYRNQRNAEAVARYWNKPLDRPDWWQVNNQADDDAEIFIHDVLGWPYQDVNELTRIISGLKARTLTVRINSPGGDVIDAMSLYNALANYPGRVVTRVEGLAASMASVVAMSGTEIQAYKNTWMMIHRSWVVSIGNEDELENDLNIIRKIDSQIIDIYASRTGNGKREVRQMMIGPDDKRSGTYMTAKEAKEKGFVTSIIENGKGAKALFDLSIFNNVPDGLDHGPGGKDLNKREVERALRDAGASASFAKKTAALFSGTTPDAQRDVDDLRNLLNYNINLWR